MNKDRRKLNEEILVDIFEQDPTYISTLSDEEIQKEVDKHQKLQARQKRNPNRFFIINGLPSPKEYQTKTSSKAGLWIVLSLFIVLLLAFGMFMLIAFVINK